MSLNVRKCPRMSSPTCNDRTIADIRCRMGTMRDSAVQSGYNWGIRARDQKVEWKSWKSHYIVHIKKTFLFICHKNKKSFYIESLYRPFQLFQDAHLVGRVGRGWVACKRWFEPGRAGCGWQPASGGPAPSTTSPGTRRVGPGGHIKVAAS